MPTSCVAFNCSQRFKKNSGVSFHKFPRSEELRKKWVHAIKRDRWQPTDASRLCSLHFEPKLIRFQNGYCYLDPNAVPTLFNLHQTQCNRRSALRRCYSTAINIANNFNNEVFLRTLNTTNIDSTSAISAAATSREHNYCMNSPSLCKRIPIRIPEAQVTEISSKTRKHGIQVTEVISLNELRDSITDEIKRQLRFIIKEELKSHFICRMMEETEKVEPRVLDQITSVAKREIGTASILRKRKQNLHVQSVKSFL